MPKRPVNNDDEPRLFTLNMIVCELCLAGMGGECHTPGCAFWLKSAPDLPLCCEYNCGVSRMEFDSHHGLRPFGTEG